MQVNSWFYTVRLNLKFGLITQAYRNYADTAGQFFSWEKEFHCKVYDKREEKLERERAAYKERKLK